ncbi:MFS family permease [Spinactinospora alkalitolerans]|uniref:MFS family permease n=1 Tax=Spinactinospora alkalitolerans TaxID=687207 RepID=A0A852U193_9ACTN|nr:serine/threonine protein kinase [Spinactinospora alkalitolerans]NYE50616.1 MFS family permease [Spinactinospora alkalitolerans]
MESDGARSAPLAPLALDDPDEIGAFRLIGRLGAGGMGVVYFGRDASGYPAAVKTVRAEYAADPGYRARFAREVDLAQRVRGRCIAPLLAAGPDEERPWLAVAYVSGPTLRSHLAEHGPLHGGDLTAFAAGLAEALAAIHREDIVHRDLKPENVILSPEGPKVLDFGIAQALDEVSMTRMDMVVGTPGWISPERYDGRRAGPASDMFCWGGLVALAASGRLPYGTGPMEVLRHRTVNEEPDAAADVLPDALRGIVGRALSRDPADRPDAAEVFAAITGESVDDADAAAAQEHMTRVATRLIDADWGLRVSDAGARFPTDPVRASTARRPVTFAGESVHEPAALAELFRRHSGRAEQWLRGDGSGKLRDWLDDIGDTVYDRDYLRGIGSVEQAAVAVTAFVAGYLRDGVPVYRGREVDAEGLRRLAAGGPAERRLLSEIVLNEVPLITAVHRCGHPGCGPRCARLERIGLRTRTVVDAALTAAGRIGLRPAPAERDRAVAVAVETVDDPTRRAAREAVLRSWSALPVPWWRHVARRALRADPGTDEGCSELVLARLAVPYARTAAAPAWRRTLSPRTWLGRGTLRVVVLSFLLWCTVGAAWSGILRIGEMSPSSHPLHPDASRYGVLVAHQTVVWPLLLLMSLGLAALPARRRLGGAVFGTLIALVYATVAVVSPPRLPVLVPDLVREPVVGVVTGMGTWGWAPLLLSGLAAPLLFIWLAATLPQDPAPQRVARPLLHGSGAPVRISTAIAGLGLVVWLPGWSVMLLLALGFSGEPGVAEEMREVFGALTLIALPVALAYAALAYLLWRPLGGHTLYVGALAQVLLGSEFHGVYLSMGLTGFGGFSTWLVLEQPAPATWIALLLPPAAYGFGVWLCERLRYRRPQPRTAVPAAGYPYPPHHGYPPPMPGQSTPMPGYATPMPGYGTMPGYAAPMPGYGAPHPGPVAQGYPVPTSPPYLGGPAPGTGDHRTGPRVPALGQWAPQSPPSPPATPTGGQGTPPAPTWVQPDPTRVEPDATRVGVDPTRIEPDATRVGVEPTRVQPGVEARTEIVPNPGDRPEDG